MQAAGALAPVQPLAPKPLVGRRRCRALLLPMAACAPLSARRMALAAAAAGGKPQQWVLQWAQRMAASARCRPAAARLQGRRKQLEGFQAWWAGRGPPLVVDAAAALVGRKEPASLAHPACAKRNGRIRRYHYDKTASTQHRRCVRGQVILKALEETGVGALCSAIPACKRVSWEPAPHLRSNSLLLPAAYGRRRPPWAATPCRTVREAFTNC